MKSGKIKNDDFFFDNYIVYGWDDSVIESQRTTRIIELFGFCICLKGSTEITVDSKKYKIREGDVCSIFPSILHVRNTSADFQGYIISIAPEFIYNLNITSSTQMYLHIKENRCIPISKQEQENIINRCADIEAYLNKDSYPYSKEITEHLVAVLIYEILCLYKKGVASDPLPFLRKDQLYFDFIELINLHYKQERGVDFYANKLCISSRYLSTICKEIEGVTAKQCIDEQLLIGIRTALISTVLTIAEIADDFNFPNASFFTRYFKEHTGMTPKQYRQSNGSSMNF